MIMRTFAFMLSLAILSFTACGKKTPGPTDVGATTTEPTATTGEPAKEDAPVAKAEDAATATAKEDAATAKEDATTAKAEDAAMKGEGADDAAEDGDDAMPGPGEPQGPQGSMLHNQLAKLYTTDPDSEDRELKGKPLEDLLDDTLGVYVETYSSAMKDGGAKLPHKVWVEAADVRANAKSETHPLVAAVVVPLYSMLTALDPEELMCDDGKLTCDMSEHPFGTLYRFARIGDPPQLKLVGLLHYDAPYGDDPPFEQLADPFDAAIDKKLKAP
jgi:hypothetical protein